MGTEDQKKWDEKHAGRHSHDAPSSFLHEVLDSRSWTIQPGRALEIATGKGRNALLLAERGFQVDAMDISPVALEEARKIARARALDINFIETDLDGADIAPAAYDLVVNFNFLQRDLIPRMKTALKPGGRVVFETFLIDQRVLGHPRNPSYLLGHNELLELFRDFRVLYYREGQVLQEAKKSFRASLFAQKT
ncbi:MAG TPA: methyltransferase domain-containing protein [Candidatus Binatia bacterium]